MKKNQYLVEINDNDVDISNIIERALVEKHFKVGSVELFRELR